ncbi:hypothetical protein [Planobispora longispora]|uniref:hypothetical protein n=1 Tax=Planobispora longispora TaxID=28887 RepID=UPI001942DD2A|nr:hypothetical protein [Planobispora longispora]
MERPPGSALAWLAHPATVTATFLLLINDHLLKGLWPGPVTGKLSDFAGLMVAPPLLALTRLPVPAAILATGVGFTVVKTTETGAALASQAWTALAGPSQVLADPTDLLALPALGAAWLVWRRCRSEQAVRQARTLIIVPVALIAVTATAGPGGWGSTATTAVSVEDDAITVFFDEPGADPVASRDGGRTWRAARSLPSPDPASTATSEPSATSEPDSPSVSSARPSAKTQDCVPGEPVHCYRITPPRLAVEESHDGGKTWETTWEVSEGREDMMRRRHGGSWAQHWKGSQAIAVQKKAGGHVVVVATGSDGIAVRDVSGTWQRLGVHGDGFLPEAAAPLNAPEIDLEAERVVGFFAGLLPLLAGVAAACRYRRSGTAFLVIASTIASLGFLIARQGMGEPFLFVNLPLVLGIACALLGMILMIVTAVSMRLRGWAWLYLLAVPPATMFGIWGVFAGWTRGTPDHYVTAVVISCLVTTVGMAVTAAICWSGVRAPIGRAGEEEPG